MSGWSGGTRRDFDRPEVALPPLLSEFRQALRDEIDAASRAASSAAVELVNGRRVAERAGAVQYVFVLESPLFAPEDSPADLIVPGREPIQATIVSVQGLSVQVSVATDLGEFVGRARLHNDPSILLRALISRIEALAESPNPAGD